MGYFEQNDTAIADDTGLALYDSGTFDESVLTDEWARSKVEDWCWDHWADVSYEEEVYEDGFPGDLYLRLERIIEDVYDATMMQAQEDADMEETYNSMRGRDV